MEDETAKVQKAGCPESLFMEGWPRHGMMCEPPGRGWLSLSFTVLAAEDPRHLEMARMKHCNLVLTVASESLRCGMTQ